MRTFVAHRQWLPLAALATALALWAGLSPEPAAAVDVDTEEELRAAFADGSETLITSTSPSLAVQRATWCATAPRH
jgi:hypothetical protein